MYYLLKLTHMFAEMRYTVHITGSAVQKVRKLWWNDVSTLNLSTKRARYIVMCFYQKYHDNSEVIKASLFTSIKSVPEYS